MLGLRTFRHLLQLVPKPALPQVSGQRAPALAPGAGTGVAARQLRTRCLHPAAGTGSARLAEQTADLQPTLSRQCSDLAGDRPQRSASSACSIPGTSDCNIILMSTACWPPAASLLITPAGSPPAALSSFPSKCSAESSAASVSPDLGAHSAKAHSSFTDISYRLRSRTPSPPGCDYCSVTTGSSTPNGPSAGQNMCCAISALTLIASPSPTAGW